MARFKKIHFSVDSALLTELGERLVGRPYIALAELIKNSYDADATKCVISIHDDYIEVSDNGAGMTDAEFQGYWMRIGTTNKQRVNTTKKFKRTVTGSKGIGRLSAQFLGRKLKMETCSVVSGCSGVECRVDWDEAVSAGSLTKAPAIYAEFERASRKFADGSRHGTKIRIESLAHKWGADAIRDVAREVWRLQPPAQLSAPKRNRKGSFVVQLEGKEQLVSAFNYQTKSALENWQAKITGSLVGGRSGEKASVVVQFRDGKKYTQSYSVPNGALDKVEFQIRVFKLSGRQPNRVPVGEVREYMRTHGGINVYDQDFRLPYYGSKEQDWLEIEQDHAHRLSKSGLLPPKLQVERGLQDLPTSSRVFGVVEISTAHEQKSASRKKRDKSDYLQIQLTRDRLVGNAAYDDLVHVVRWAIDFYSTRVQLRRLEAAKKAIAKSKSTNLGSARSIVESYQDQIPSEIAEKLTIEIDDAIATEKAKERVADEEKSLLGALASAGMAAISLEHESKKELSELQSMVNGLKRSVAAKRINRDEVLEAISDFRRWIKRVRETRKIFSPLMSEADRSEKAKYKAKATLQNIVDNSRPLMRGIDVRLEMPASLRLPEATMATWNAVFQNVLINAVNAMIDSEQQQISCTGGIVGKSAYILIQDTGVGVNLESSDELFVPFHRELQISRERQELGLGGSGLGLTIVRMLADTASCGTKFVEPSSPYSTAFRISWPVKK